MTATDPKDPYTWPAFIPPFHIPLEKRVAAKVEAEGERSKWVCNIHGFHVERCCQFAKAIQEAK